MDVVVDVEGLRVVLEAETGFHSIPSGHLLRQSFF